MDREQVLFRLFGKYCPAGTILYTEGSPGEELYLVQSGAVRVTPPGAPAGGGEERGPGRILGEEGFFGRTPRAARAEVVRDSRLLLVSDRNLDALARQGPDAARAVVEGLLEQTAEAARQLEAWVLGRLALRLEPHLSVAAPCGAAELAERAGIAPRDARAVLEALVAHGAVVCEEGGYRASEPAALEQAVLALAAASR